MKASFAMPRSLDLVLWNRQGIEEDGSSEWMVSVARLWGGEEASHSCSVCVYFPPKKSEHSLLVEEKVLRAQGGHAGSTSTDYTPRVFLHSNTFRDIFGCIRVSWVFTLLPMFAEQQQG